MFGFKKKKDISEPVVQPEQENAVPEEIPAPEPSVGLFGRLRAGLSKTSSQLGEGIGVIFTKRKLDDEALEELEDLLIMSDMGAPAAAKITAQFSKERFDKEIEETEVKAALAQEVATLLRPVEQPLAIDAAHRPHIIMVVGVNGNGKTTTIGKLALRFQAQGHSVMLAAADTFRAAAVEQLSVWAQRAKVPIVTGAHEADPASVAYAAVERARQEGTDVLLIDTAGRLQNKQNLMEELAKISRVIRKLDEDAPHDTLMVLDGTTGQNALSQAKTFCEFVDVTGFAITKLDGTAKGGMVVALADAFGLPVHYVGVGEGIEDLQTFQANDFARSLVGVE